MPATSKAQARFMNAVAHNPGFAKEAGVPQSVGKEFSAKGERYKSLPERKADAPKKKGWLKGGKGEKKLKAKLSQKQTKTESQRMAGRYGS
jgi:hypothetical protein